jgi:DNA-damage-inducible protein D
MFRLERESSREKIQWYRERNERASIERDISAKLKRMSSEVTVVTANAFEKIKRVNNRGGEFWSARELARVLEYSDFRNFITVINKARQACTNSDRAISDHFVDTTEMVGIGSGAWRPIEDWALSRYACYLIIQNADPSKPLVALGQNYFAVQTRRQELADAETLKEGEKRLRLRHEMKKHSKQLASAAKQAGVVQPADYDVFMDHGYRGLYGGLGAKDIQDRKQANGDEDALDRMGSTELAANLFRATQTEEKLRRENVRSKQSANEIHEAVGKKIRQTIRDLGGTMPENLPPAEDIRKLAGRGRKRLK